MNKLKKYIICEKEIGLEECDSWAIVEAKNEEEAFDLFIKKKVICNKAFLCILDICNCKEKRIYDGETEELDSRISEDMLMFIYKKENTEVMLILDIDEKII